MSSLELGNSFNIREFKNIPGLYYYKTKIKEVNELKAECEKILNENKSNHKKRRMSKFIEIGNSFISTEDVNDPYFNFIEPKSKSQKVILKFILEQIKFQSNFLPSIGKNISSIDFRFINVILREYNPGQGIGFHIDRTNKIEDLVWNCIIECGNPKDGLHYRILNSNGDLEDIPFLERPGITSIQTGQARNTFKHGIDSVKSKRISLTWRFFKQEYLSSVKGYINVSNTNTYLNILQNQFNKKETTQITQKSNPYSDCQYSLFPSKPLLFDCSSISLGNTYSSDFDFLGFLKGCDLLDYLDVYKKLNDEEIEYNQLISLNLKDFNDINISNNDALKIIKKLTN